MKKDPSCPVHRRRNNRSHALALGALALSLFMPIGESPVLAERLDLGLQPLQETTFDDAALEPAPVDPQAVDQPVLADNGAKQEEPEGPDQAPDGPETDAAEAADNDEADGTELAADADVPDGEPSDETNAQETDMAADADAPDVETAELGELPEPQPPQLLWRFKTLFAHNDSTDDSPDTIEEIEEHLSHIPLIRTARVERHIHYFQTSHRDHFDQWLTRLNHYKPLVEKIFAQFQLPDDLVFLSLVESGFNPKAYSRARAAGPWQFMKATGKIYGLRVDDYVDERRDPIKSTVAAARYLRDLYDLFGTWPLAMAAYNAGERKIQRALRKANAETFWEIAQTKFIRRETREYVPRFMAAAIIAKHPDQYGFEEVPADVHQFEEIVVSRPFALRAIAAATEIPYAELHRLNPELRRDVTPPDDPAYHLKVPVGSRATVEQALATIKPWTPPVVTARFKRESGRHVGQYRVRMGDNLGKIAKRFRLTVEELKARNKLSGRSIKVGDVLVVGR
jgi:membrane-bound lytic murein transglycosylase D